jgi:acyl carrier protein
MNMLDIERVVRSFIQENLLYGKAVTFSDDDSFLGSGVMDSTAVLELVLFVEEQYGINVEDDELVPENLDSVNRVASYVRTKNGRALEHEPS